MKRFVLLSLLLTACTSKGPRCGTGAVRMELRDGAGALQLRVVESANKGELDLCDAGGQRTGVITTSRGALVLLDRTNAERLRAVPGTESVQGPGGAEALRLHHDGPILRVLAVTGVPYGTLNELDGGTLVSDPGGSPIARVTRRDADSVLSAPDGTARSYLVPGPTLPASGFLALEGLPLEERVFLAAYVGRGALQP